MSQPKTTRKPVTLPMSLRAIRWVFPKVEKISSRLALIFFEYIFFSPLRYKTPERERIAERSAKKFSVVAFNKKIQCYEWGDEKLPYVLVVHGWAGRATQFRKFIPLFNKGGYRIIGFDGPAHGQSEGRRTSIIEFEEAIKSIANEKGLPQAIIAHSFGGGASLYAIVNGFAVNKLINIATPTIADRIIQSYLKAIGGSWKTGQNFKKFIQQKHNRSFDEFTILHLIKRAPSGLQLLLVHDENDRDVDIGHAHELIKVYPSARLLATSGLGHNRILKDDQVITACLEFVRSDL
jgi:hypothetical protein